MLMVLISGAVQIQFLTTTLQAIERAASTWLTKACTRNQNKETPATATDSNIFAADDDINL